jgi:hypothetical protein
VLTLDDLLDGETPIESGNVLRTVSLGTLELPTGQLAARDPLAGADTPAFNLAITPGRYPVSMRVIFTPNAPASRLYFDVAALVIRFRPGPCARWDIALTDLDPPKEELRAGRFPGFMVDTAHAALLDVTAQSYLDAEDMFKRVEAARHPPGGGLLELGPNLNMAFCSSGAGDGVYAAFVGYGADGKPTALLIDFKMVEVRRPQLLGELKLDARVMTVMQELVHLDDERTLHAAISEAAALGSRARTLVPLLEDLVVDNAERPLPATIRDSAARSLAELVPILSLHDHYANVLITGEPAEQLEAALVVAARIDWGTDRDEELGAAAARIATTTESPRLAVAALRCLDLFGVADPQVWSTLAAHREASVRIAVLDAAARNYRAERAAEYDEGEREYRAHRVGINVLDAAVALCMHDPLVEVRAAAANALGVAVAESPLRRIALLPAIEDPEPRVVLAATQHLTFRKDLDADLIARMRTALERIANSDDRTYRMKATNALRRLPSAGN